MSEILWVGGFIIASILLLGAASTHKPTRAEFPFFAKSPVPGLHYYNWMRILESRWEEDHDPAEPGEDPDFTGW